MTPEQIAAHIRDPGSPLYPTQIGVFCDGCGTTVKHDYLVHEDMDQTARFEVARSHLRRNEGWSCGDAGDFCPTCATPTDASEEPADAACRGCATSLTTCWAEGARCCDACAHPADTTGQTRGDV